MIGIERRPRYARKREDRPVTVCIAAVCQWGSDSIIAGCADRMITYGDVQYEPVRTKIYQFTSSVIAMTSGDSSAQFAICVAVHNRVRTLNNPTVETIAEIYAEEYASFRRKRNERRFLTPLGLDCFNLHRQGMNRDQVDQLTSLLVSTPWGMKSL